MEYFRVSCGQAARAPKNKCCAVSSRRSHSKLPERSHITNPQATSLINEHLAGVAASEPGRVSARIGAGCPVEGKARPARCGMRLSCCLHSAITLFDLCMACFGVSCGQAARAPKNKCCAVSSRRSHSKLPERSHITNPQATSLINEHLAGVAASEPGRVSARIGAGCPVEGKARPARCGMRLSCCLHSAITLFDLCMACFGVSCGQAARAPKNKCCAVSSRRSHSKLPERSHITNPQATSLINEHLAGVAASEPGRVSARIGAGCPVEGKARPARCGMHLSCCLLSIITLLDLCVECFEVSCGQAARAPTAN